MARLQRQRFEDSRDIRSIPHGKVEFIELDDRAIARLTWEPGWKWSVDMKPIAKTEWCMAHHVGVGISGRIRVQMSDGIELEMGAGDIVEIPAGHDAWVVGDEPYVYIDFEAARGFGKIDPNAIRRTLATILFTDIVDSTAQAVGMGAAKWQDAVSRHNEMAERIIDRHEGRLVKTTGDGVIGLFDSAERALRAAVALVDAVQRLGLHVRAAVHTGEVESTAGDVRGIAVHATARMMALAGADEIVASSTVRDVVDGTDLVLEDFGLHELKGLPGQRQLYRLVVHR